MFGGVFESWAGIICGLESGCQFVDSGTWAEFISSSQISNLRVAANAILNWYTIRQIGEKIHGTGGNRYRICVFYSVWG